MGYLRSDRLELSNSSKILSFNIDGGIAQNTWYSTGYARTGTYQHSGAFILMNFSNQDADGANLFGMARSRSTVAFLGGANNVTWDNLAGSTGVEAKWTSVSGSGGNQVFQLHVRVTDSNAGDTYEMFHGMIFMSDA